MSQYLTLLTCGVINLGNGNTGSVTYTTVNNPSNPTQTLESGNIVKSEYMTLAVNVKNFVDSYGRLPNYVSSSLGKFRYESVIYMFSKIVIFYGTNNRLPNYVSVTPWTGTSTSSSSSSSSSSTSSELLSEYLQATLNCQSDSSTIIALANSITSGKTTDYAKAQAIFNWVRDNLTYSFYYNSVKGALGALSDKTANCCDTSNLVVALARAAGIPARYQHGYCHFSSGWYGHVWAQLYVDGNWYYADAISDYNTFGAINNWDLSTVTLYNTYTELPF